MNNRDYIVRAAAADEQIRAFAATTKTIAETARVAHNLAPVATAALGRLMSAGVMMGIMMKGDRDLLSIRIDADGPLQGMLITADSHGHVKGYVGNPDVTVPDHENGHLNVGMAVGNGMLSVIKDLGLKDPYVGNIELQTGEIAEDMTYYFAASEQTPSSVGLGVLVDRDGSVLEAGGFIVQLMPNVTDDVIDRLEANIRTLPSVTDMLRSGMTPEDILNRILDGLQPEFYEQTEASFVCGCSKERYTKGLISLGRKELEKLIQDEENIEVRCQFCNHSYIFTTDEIREMMQFATK